MLSAECYHTCNDSILIAFRQVAECDHNILEVLAWIWAVLTWLSYLALLKAGSDPGWLYHVDSMLERGEVLRKLDVRGHNMRDFVQIDDLLVIFPERKTSAAVGCDCFLELARVSVRCAFRVEAPSLTSMRCVILNSSSGMNDTTTSSNSGFASSASSAIFVVHA